MIRKRSTSTNRNKAQVDTHNAPRNKKGKKIAKLTLKTRTGNHKKPEVNTIFANVNNPTQIVSETLAYQVKKS